MKYGAILADPPWAFVTYAGEWKLPTTGGDTYKTMSLDALAALQADSVAADDCVLFLWTIDSHLDQAMELGQAWGFEYKTIAFIWVKSNEDSTFRLFPAKPSFGIGMGYWTRKQAELCLLFTRGKPKRLDRGVRQIIDARRREHSRKPNEQYERIERLVAGPYLEMFARQRRPGWDAWGNETTKFAAEESS